MSVMLAREMPQVQSVVRSDVAPLNRMIRRLLDEVAGVSFLRDPTRGGLATSLCEIAAASGGRLGGTRCLAALRLILSACQATVIPNQLALPFADEAYDDMDRLKHPADIEALNALVRQLIDVSQRMM